MSLQKKLDELEEEFSEYRDWAEAQIEEGRKQLDELEETAEDMIDAARLWIKRNYQGVIAGLILGALLATGAS